MGSSRFRQNRICFSAENTQVAILLENYRFVVTAKESRICKLSSIEWYSRLEASLRRSNQILVGSQSTPILGHCSESSTSMLWHRYYRHPRPMPILWECSFRYWHLVLHSLRIAENRREFIYGFSFYISIYICMYIYIRMKND